MGTAVEPVVAAFAVAAVLARAHHAGVVTRAAEQPSLPLPCLQKSSPAPPTQSLLPVMQMSFPAPSVHRLRPARVTRIALAAADRLIGAAPEPEV